ncbi:hypothetical protein GXW82_34500 [Streptacidiphilus sp. 4-A2]|nr:hypothetical protein [Streptacidiphilus sp. 4-A2]
MADTRETPLVLAQLPELVAAAAERQGGALWRLAEAGRQLDANLIRLAPGAQVAEHAEGTLDVLLVVVAGSGELGGGPLGVGRPGEATDRAPLAPGTLVWLPRLSHRSLYAGPEGLVYLTAHQRRPGLSIAGSVTAGRTGAAASVGAGTGAGTSAGAVDGGEAPCLLNRICPGCDRVATEAAARFCAHCGTALPVRED